MKIMRGKGNRGAILILALLGLTTVSILAGAFVQMGTFEQRFSERSQAGVQAFYLSESAIDQGLGWLRSQLVAPQWTDRRVLFGGYQPLGANGLYMVTVDPDDNNPNTDTKRYTIDGWGVTGSLNAPVAMRHSQLIVQTESFSQYAYFTNSERSWPNGIQVYFITGDRLTGPVHTNGQFAMYGRPVFEGPVSSVASSIYYWGGSQTTNPSFSEPPKLGVAAKKYPTTMPETTVNAARNGGRVFQGNTSVTLLPDGTMRVTNPRQGLADQVMPLPANGVLYVEGGNLSLQGTLKGRLTTAASGDVNLTGSVVYSDDPRRNPNSKDMLGIVAGQNVVVPRNAPHDLKVDGSVMAINRSFGVENWWERPPKGTLSIYGGVIQANRGPVGSFNGNTGTKISGYTKDYRYDPRLRTMAPPSFPGTGEFKQLLWQED